MATRSKRADTAEPTRAAQVAADHGAAGLRVFARLAEAWKLSTAEQQRLLQLPRSTLAKYRADPETARLGPDTAERLSYLFGIYRALQILLPRPEAADGWIRTPHGAP